MRKLFARHRSVPRGRASFRLLFLVRHKGYFGRDRGGALEIDFSEAGAWPELWTFWLGLVHDYGCGRNSRARLVHVLNARGAH